MKTSELRNLSTEDLLKKEQNIKKELFELRNLRSVGQVEKSSDFGKLRKDIARILTILKERELEDVRKN